MVLINVGALFIMLCACAITVRLCNKVIRSLYSPIVKNNASTAKLTFISATAGAVGMTFARILLSDISQNSVIIVIACIAAFLFAIFVSIASKSFYVVFLIERFLETPTEADKAHKKKHNMQRLIIFGAFALVFVAAMLIPGRETNNLPTNNAYIEDHEFINIVQARLNEAGFNLHPPHEDHRLYVLATIDSTGGQVESSIILVDEIRSINVAFVSNSQYTGFGENHLPRVAGHIHGHFTQKHEVNVDRDAVFFNIARAGWDMYEQEENMAYIMYHLQQQIETFILRFQ